MQDLKKKIDTIIDQQIPLTFQNIISSSNRYRLLEFDQNNAEGIQLNDRVIFTRDNENIIMSINQNSSELSYDNQLDIFMGVRLINGEEFIVTIYGREVTTNMLLIEISYHHIHLNKDGIKTLTHNGTIHPLP